MEHRLSVAQRMPSCIKHVSLPSKRARHLALTHAAQTNDLCLSHPLLLLLLLLLAVRETLDDLANVCCMLPPPTSDQIRTRPWTSRRSSTSRSSEPPSGVTNAASCSSIRAYAASKSLKHTPPSPRVVPPDLNKPASACSCRTTHVSRRSLACTPKERTRADCACPAM